MKKINILFLGIIIACVFYICSLNTYNYRIGTVKSLLYLEGNENIELEDDEEQTEIDLSKYQAYYGIFDGVIELSVPFKEGYEFLGWYTSDGVKVTDENGKVINEDFNLDNNSQTISGSGRLDTDIHLVAHFNKIDEVTENIFEYDQEELKISDNVIYGLSFGTSKGDILSLINTNANIKFLDNKDIVIGDNDNIKTGDKLRLTFSNEVIEYKLSVSGDVLGTGELSRENAKEIAKHIIKKNVINEKEYLLASDYDNDGKIKMNDVIKMLRDKKNKENS